ncbi:MAG: HlyD family secretion protein [Planctomycetota bacterium]
MASEQRRLAAFPDAPATRSHKRKALRMTGMLALIIASACLGAAGTYAAVQIEDEALKTLLMTKADLLREQALLRFDTVAQELDRTKPFVDDGLVTMSELDELRCQVAVAQADLRAREFDVEEITLTGAAPRNDLGARLVEGRDFVLGRIEAQRKAVGMDLERQQKSLARMAALADRGAVTRLELDAVEHDVQNAEAKLRQLDRRRELRAAFLAGTLTADAVELLALADRAAVGVEESQRMLEGAQRTLERAAKQVEAGVVTRTELRRAEVDVQTLQRRLRLAELERELVERRLELESEEHDE